MDRDDNEPTLMFGLILVLSVFAIIFSTLDPHEEDRRKEFMVWEYQEESFVRSLASDLFQEIGLTGNFSSEDVIEKFERLAEEEESHCNGRQGSSKAHAHHESKQRPVLNQTSARFTIAEKQVTNSDLDKIEKVENDRIAHIHAPNSEKVTIPRSSQTPQASGQPSKERIIVNISLIPGTGWGHLGYEVFFGLLDEVNISSGAAAVEPIFVGDVHPDALLSSSPHAARLPPLLASQRDKAAALLAAGAGRVPHPAVHATDHFRFDRPRLVGTPNVALVFFDSFNFTPPLLAAAAAAFDAVVAGSAWNAAVLRRSGLALPVHLVRQASWTAGAPPRPAGTAGAALTDRIRPQSRSPALQSAA